MADDGAQRLRRLAAGIRRELGSVGKTARECEAALPRLQVPEPEALELYGAAALEND